MKVFRSRPIVFIIGCSTALLADAFTSFRHFSPRTPSLTSVGKKATTEGLTTMRASLDASLSEATAAVDARSSSTVMASAVIKSFEALQLEHVFSKGWFKALYAATHDSLVLMSQMPIWLEAFVLLTPLVVIAHLYLFRLSHPPAHYRRGMEPYPRGKYDPVRARRYYSQHPLLVAQRFAELFRLSNQWLFKLLAEKYVWKNEEEHREERAQELLDLCSELGPTAVKICQALSVRSDILPDEYTKALSTLQDRVPPFDSEHAKQILRRELGPDKFAKLEGLEKGPVASASIGQVYRCKLDGKDVAVKVQRPDVLSEIALDLYLARELAPIYKKIIQSPTDFQTLANEWGRGK